MSGPVVSVYRGVWIVSDLNSESCSEILGVTSLGIKLKNVRNCPKKGENGQRPILAFCNLHLLKFAEGYWTKLNFEMCSINWYIPSEKIGKNFHPSESCFFVINYQHWTGRSAFRPFLALPDHWGVWGGLGGLWGV